MLTIEDDYVSSLPCSCEELGSEEGLLFFDIETTGLSAKSSMIYLIGSLYTDGTEFHLKQFFAQCRDDELCVLNAFNEYLATLPAGCLLTHFNGNNFDLPFLRQRCERCHITSPLFEMNSCDLYRMIRPYKNLLGLPSLRQKAIEDYLGIDREDPFDGGQLIAVYEDYVQTKSPLGLQALLKHNDEDLRNMPKLLSIRNLRSCLEAEYQPISEEVHHAAALDGHPTSELLIRLDNPCPLPRPVTVRMDSGIYLTASDSRISLAVPIVSGEMKHYFDDPRDYFYLPVEDRAVHKSVGIYVDREYREKATRDTCYTRRTGEFIPCPEGMRLSASPAATENKACKNEPCHEESAADESLQEDMSELSRYVFRHDRQDKGFYLEWNGPDDVPWKNCAAAFWSEYVHAIWKSSK